ncbi:MAG: hypothetical protein EOP51_06445 [Sphingobacteriales bacterium]|nr:MAG: hypothetical protein EOP51_06445 [Sphingobacteriales bacterium]
MKPILLALAITLSYPTIARVPVESYDPKIKANEIGLTVSAQSLNNDFDYKTASVIYKHWMNEHIGWRAMAGYGYYNGANTLVASRYTADTLYRLTASNRTGMPLIGLGLEAERHFYKRVFMYAAIDMQAGYGTGSVDSSISKEYVGADKRSHSNGIDNAIKNKNYSLLFIGLAPTVGAKVHYHKISVGAEISPIKFTCRAETRRDIPTSVLNFDLSWGDLFQRFYFSYRF